MADNEYYYSMCRRNILSVGFVPETGEREEFPYTPIAEVSYGGLG